MMLWKPQMRCIKKMVLSRMSHACDRAALAGEKSDGKHVITTRCQRSLLRMFHLMLGVG